MGSGAFDLIVYVHTACDFGAGISVALISHRKCA